MKGVARRKTFAQKIPRFLFLVRAVHRRPLRRQLVTAFEAPVGVSFGDSISRPLVADGIEQPPAHHLADFPLVIGDQVLGHPLHYLGDFFLPLHIALGHLHRAARQADDGDAVGGCGHGHRQVLDKGMKPVGQFGVAIHKVQHFVKEHQHRSASLGKNALQRRGSRRRLPGIGAKRPHPGIAGQLPGQVYPRRFVIFLRVPGRPHEHRYFRRRRLRESGINQQFAHPVVAAEFPAAGGQVIERAERMRLAAAELRHQRHHRRGVGRPARQPPQHHAAMLAQCARKAGARKELHRVTVILRRRSLHHLRQINGELVGVERTPLAHLGAGGYGFIPGGEGHGRVSAWRWRMGRL